MIHRMFIIICLTIPLCLAQEVVTPEEGFKVPGVVRDGQGKVVAGIPVTEFQTDQTYTTDAQGEFLSTYGPSDERRFFFAVDKDHKRVGVGRFLPGQSQVEITMKFARIVSGRVLDPDGHPVAGAQVAPLPMTCFHVLTNQQGEFDVGWSPDWAGSLEDYFLMVRHPARNLVGGGPYSSEVQDVKVKLVPGLTLAGIVQDPNKDPIIKARVSLSLIRGWNAGTPIREAVTDSEGRFSFNALHQEQEYGIRAKASGYVSHGKITGLINKTTDREDIGIIILKQPILSISGRVVNADGDVVAGIPVYLSGEGQPRLNVTTDDSGQFMFEGVCRGPVSISTKNETLFGRMETQGGAQNIELMAGPRFGPHAVVRIGRTVIPSLIDRPMPGLDTVQIDLTPNQIRDHGVCVCLWDMTQRPSRNAILQLAKHAEQLEAKDLILMAVEISTTNPGAVHAWTEENHIPFSVGTQRGDEDKMRLNWGIKALPWLVLTDEKHNVVAKGLSVEEVEEILKETNDEQH